MKLRSGRVIGEAEQPFVIAEVNTSHFGDLNIARDMVLKAKEAGCDCVKFQSWSEESLYSRSFYDDNPIARRFVKKFSFAEAQLAEIASFSRSRGIEFSSTPYSRKEVDFLVHGCAVPFVKVASMELNNYDYLDYIGRTGVPIVLSTGMGDIEEIRKAVKTIENTGNEEICILHCVSIYPPDISSMRLKNIVGLREEFPRHPIGFSDHSLGTEMATAAVALGACVIEKHLTLDSKKIGMDNQMAAEPADMARLVRHCHNVHLALGDSRRIVSQSELDQRQKMRRSIIAARDLTAGTRLTLEDLDFKRPGNGIPPDRARDIVGKTLLRDVEADRLIGESDLS